MTKKTTAAATAATNAQGDWWAKTATAPKQQSKILQTIPFTLGTFDDKNRTFKAIGSSSAVDRQGDTIDQSGWDLENFKKNPVIPWAHDYYQPPVARAIEVGVEDGVLVFTAQFPEKGLYPFADTIWNLYRNGYMFAFSVGFIPEEPEEGWSWEGNNFTKCELLEISAVVVPANPQALALAAKSGHIDEAQTKTLISKLGEAQKGLEAVLEAQQADKDIAAATKGLGSVEDAVKATLAVLEQKGLIKTVAAEETVETEEVEEKDLTDINTKKENEDMTELNEETKTLMKDAAEAMKLHANDLVEHGETMKSNADVLIEKADAIIALLSKSEDGAEAEGAEEVHEDAAEDAVVEEVAEGEVKSDDKKADEDAEEVAEDAAGDAEEEAVVEDGADHEETAEDKETDEEATADEEEELYDVDDLPAEVVEKILASFNSKVEQ